MSYPKDLREHIQLLESNGLLWRIKRPVKRETELMPLVRWQFRGLQEDQRKAFLFENVTDFKGRRYDIPVLVGAMAASTKIYALGMGCKPNEISDRWLEAQRQPILPRLVKNGPVHEEVHTGKELLEQGLDEFPPLLPILFPKTPKQAL